MEMSIYTSVNQDNFKTLAQKNKNNPMVLNTRNIVVTVLHMPFILTFFFFTGLQFFFFCLRVNYNDKSQKSFFPKVMQSTQKSNQCYHKPPATTDMLSIFTCICKLCKEKTVNYLLLAMQLPHVAYPVTICSRNQCKFENTNISVVKKKKLRKKKDRKKNKG